MAKSFDILADFVNGQILDSPLTVLMKCGQAVPMGMSIVKDYDADMCVVAKKLFLIRYGSDVYGVSSLKTVDDFYNYVNGKCPVCPCVECFPYINMCTIQINGCIVQMCGCSEHDALINNCQVLINGCEVRLN